MRIGYGEDPVYLAFVKAAYAEAGYPVVKHWATDRENLVLECDPFPPCAVVWKVASLADLAGVDDLAVCWPCYQADQNLPECPHDWRAAPQPTREELRAAP